MSEETRDEELLFDTVTPPPLPGSATVSSGVSCVVCQAAIPDEYFDVNGQTVCSTCRTAVLEQAETPRGWGMLLRAGVCGLAAAVAGAILYYAVIAITDLEIGLVAIAIGYMVGYGVRFGTGGRGGRRVQVMAMLLTYLSVSLAYSVLVIRASFEPRQTQEASAVSGTATPEETSAAQPTPAAAPSEADREDGPSGLLGLGLLLGFFLALPVMAILDSLPGGLISAAIIAFGMQQAWRMTMAPALTVTGPYRVGTAAAPVVTV